MVEAAAANHAAAAVLVFVVTELTQTVSAPLDEVASVSSV